MITETGVGFMFYYYIVFSGSLSVFLSYFLSELACFY